MLNKEQIAAMMADEEILMQEAEEIGARCVESVKTISADDIEAHTRRVISAMGISAEFLSGESCSESLSDFLNKEWSTDQSDFFEKASAPVLGITEYQHQLNMARERARANLKVFVDHVMTTMRTLSNIYVGRRGVIVRVYWPTVDRIPFRSLRTAKVWNKKRIREIRATYE